MTRSFLIPGLALLLGLGAAGLTLYGRWPSPAAPAMTNPAPVSAAVATTAPRPLPALLAARPLATQALRQPLVPGMAGTEIDGELKTDAAGNLVLDLALRDYFDYFLSAADQVGLDAAVGALVENAGGRLQEPALGQLSRLLGDYLEYKTASLALLQQPLSAAQQGAPAGQLQALQQAFDSLAQLRRAHLSDAAVEALFGAEESYARYTLDAMSLQAREDLSATAKAEAVEALREQLPQALRDSELRQAQALEQQAQREQLWRDGASEEQVRAVLAMTYDPPTVERLLAEQRADRAWQQHYDSYRQELTRLSSTGLGVDDQRAQAQQLRQRLFSADDQHRVETYDAIAAKQTEADPTPGL
ncbi:MAG: lipase secretion chaperone [Pseudomonas sp.]|uniref:lipase secretion chaperone n=1 Tax=Pseudomonas sp. TaxID=306 RepID=UPI0033910FB8